MNFQEILFLFSLFLIIYIYIGYPLVLIAWSGIKTMGQNGKLYDEGRICPEVSIIISAYNEEKYIEKKIRNTLGLNYPKDKYEVIVISDGSTDRTAEIAKSIESENYMFIEQAERKGKASALNAALKYIKGEIVVYTDANVFIEADALLNLIEAFQNKIVGAVSSRVELKALDTGEPLGESAYMKYERYLQKKESNIHSMIGTDGGLFAVRRSLVLKIPENVILDDFFIISNVLNKKYRIVYQENAVAYEFVPASVMQEFRRKTRIAAGGFQVLKYLEYLKRPVKYKTTFFFFVSHKLLRWLTPFFMLLALVENLFLIEILEYKVLFFIQLLFYLLAIAGYSYKRTRNYMIVYIPYYFVMMNLAFLFGFAKYLFGGQKVTWQHVER